MTKLTPPSKHELEQELTDLLNGLKPRQVAAVLSAPLRVRLQYAKTLSSGNSRALAVKMKCRECCGFEDAEKRVEECQVITCPLHCVR